MPDSNVGVKRLSLASLSSIETIVHWVGMFLWAVDDDGSHERANIKALAEVFTLPLVFWADSGRTPSDSTYPECQFFGSGMAGIVQ